jgi:hypothetical protein
MKRSLAAGGALAIGLTVSYNHSPPTRSTAWYQQNPSAAHLRLEVCDRLGILDRDADCLNAQQGATLAEFHGTSTVNPWK